MIQTHNYPSLMEVQLLKARIKALEAAGDGLLKAIAPDAKKSRPVLIWKATKAGGKRDERK